VQDPIYPSISASEADAGSLRIDDIELLCVRLPLVSPFETSLGVMYEKEAVIVRLRCGELVGWGEVAAWQEPWFSEETVATALYVLERYLVPSLLKGGGLETMRSSMRGHPMAKAGLEAAFLDLVGKLSGRSLAAVLGGALTPVPVGVSIGIHASLKDLSRVVDASLARGYRRIKIKIRPGWDVEPIRQLRTLFGTFDLSVDANGAYGRPDIDHLRDFDEFELSMLEQPFEPNDLPAHASLQKIATTPICLDESVRDVRGLEIAAALDACRIVNIKPGRVGGLRQAGAVQNLADEINVATFCGGMLETGIGRAANLAFASCIGGRIAHDLSPSARYFERDLIDPPIEMSGSGYVEVPSGPGIGVTVDEARLRTHLVDSRSLP
jgi:O-succinylbenzoate synthase